MTSPGIELSPAQLTRLARRLMQPETHDAFHSAQFEFSSDEHLARLIAAIEFVIDRHDILRTTLPTERSHRPTPLVDESATLSRPSAPDAERSAAVRLQVADCGSGLRQASLQVQAWACDSNSFDMLLQEVHAHLHDQQHELPEPISYVQHIASAVAPEQSESLRLFFRKMVQRLEEPSAPFAILDSRAVPRHFEDSKEVLDDDSAKRLRKQASLLGVSVESIVHAAFALVVAHTSGCDEVVYGIGISSPPGTTSEQNRRIGNFFHALPLRVSLNSETALELFQQISRTLLQLQSHTRSPTASIRDVLSTLDTTPMFTAVLDYRTPAVTRSCDTRVKGIRELRREEAWPAYPLATLIEHTGDAVTLRSRTQRPINASRINAYLSSALRVLLRATEDACATAPLWLPVLPPGERHTVLKAFNDRPALHSQEKLIHELVEKQAARTPAAPAASYHGQVLTYSEMNSRANQLARILRLHGVGPDHLVGICVERSLEMVVGLLGILKAGGAYLPLDPYYPSDRLRYMLDDARPSIILTQAKTSALLPDSKAELLPLDEFLAAAPLDDAENLSAADLGLTSKHLLYVIYTSGSTGQPKGVAMYHRAMVNLLEWHRETFGPGSPRVLQFAALSFDVAFQEVFSTLSTGGTLVLPDELTRRDARALTNLLRAESVERLFVPPLMLQTLAEQSKSTGGLPASLREIVTAGEQLRISRDVVALMKRLDRCRLHNHYGPTETHVVTSLTLAGDPEQWPALPSIGAPIANSAIYILDKQLQPVPLGAIGEIYIGGKNVARGYLNRPALTAQRFVTDPFAATAGALMYKTGDLGRWLEDGNVEYLGRNDDQVKIRGFRIELGEIEAHLARHDQVKEVAVVAREDTGGQKRLIAYLTPHGVDSIEIDDVREHLRAELPQHMIPSAFVILDRLPLTPSGKLDRRNLPAPTASAYERCSEQPPEGNTQLALAEIWRKLLPADHIGKQDDFFQLGGDSLAAMKMMIEIGERFGVTFEVHTLLHAPTLQAVAQHIEDLMLETNRSAADAEPDVEEGVI